MHSELHRHVVIEMSWLDSLSDAVNQQIHFGITPPEDQMTKAPTLLGGTQLTQKQQLC